MKRALAVFAKTPLPGFVKTRLAPYLLPEECAELYRCMLLDSLSRFRQLPVTTMVFYDGDQSFFRGELPGVQLFRQHPGGLGERLEHAFSLLADLGYQARVAVGSDAPDLPLQYVEEAFTLLQDDADTVFGPAEDGGYYLVGLRGEDSGIFKDIPWSTATVLQKSMERCREAKLRTALLPPWYDVDSHQDLWRPGLSDPQNGAPLTRAFIETLSRKVNGIAL